MSVALFMCCTEQDLDLPNNAFIVLFDKAAWCQILINNCLKKIHLYFPKEMQDRFNSNGNGREDKSQTR